MRATSTWPNSAAGRANLARVVPLLGVTLLTALVVWPAFAHAIEVWTTVSEFSFGVFVVPVALGLVWWRRGALGPARGPELGLRRSGPARR